MTQTTNRFLDELARLMTDAAGAAEGVKREVATLMRAQGEWLLREMDVVQREEFEAVKAMAEKARAENERLEQRLAALEARLAAKPPPDSPTELARPPRLLSHPGVVRSTLSADPRDPSIRTLRSSRSVVIPAQAGTHAQYQQATACKYVPSERPEQPLQAPSCPLRRRIRGSLRGAGLRG